MDEMASSEQFFFDDLSLSDDSDLEDFLFKKSGEKEESTAARADGRQTLHSKEPRAQPQKLTGDYFAEVPTYLAHLFHRRYHMRRELFVKVVEACEANSRFHSP